MGDDEIPELLVTPEVTPAFVSGCAWAAWHAAGLRPFVNAYPEVHAALATLAVGGLPTGTEWEHLGDEATRIRLRMPMYRAEVAAATFAVERADAILRRGVDSWLAEDVASSARRAGDTMDRQREHLLDLHGWGPVLGPVIWELAHEWPGTLDELVDAARLATT
jgi:hypothetical protein